MIPLQNLTVADLIAKTVNNWPKNTALVYENESWNYLQFSKMVDNQALTLLNLGVKKGEHVGIWGEISPKTLFLFYAIQKIGAVAIMVNTNLCKEELVSVATLSNIQYLFFGNFYKEINHMQTIELLQSELKSKITIINLQEDKLALNNTYTHENLAEICSKVNPQDTATILFTSGSISQPKAVMSSHYARVNSGIQQAYDMQATQWDVFCVSMPMFHCFCISVNLMAALAVGGCVCIPKDRHVENILNAIEKNKCTILSSVPTMYYAMISKSFFSPKRVESLRTGVIGGAYYHPQAFVDIENALQFTLLSSLGQTECTAGFTVCNLTDSIKTRSETVGHFMNYVEGKIVSLETGKSVPNGEKGEICVRGYINMQGYYGREDLTKSTIDSDGFLHTGDIGAIDESQNIKLYGRIKEVIIRGGENISPCEIETAALLLNEINECKAVGVHDAHYGEEICLCVSLKEKEVINEEAIREHLCNYLAYYKIPKYILFWSQFPRTATGKIRPLETALKARKELGIVNAIENN